MWNFIYISTVPEDLNASVLMAYDTVCYEGYANMAKRDDKARHFTTVWTGSQPFTMWLQMPNAFS